MKIRYIKYLGASLVAGMAVGAVGISMMCSNRGMRGTRKSAKRAMHAIGDLVDCVKHIVP